MWSVIVGLVGRNWTSEIGLSTHGKERKGELSLYLYSIIQDELLKSGREKTRILCVQVRRRPIQDGLDAVLGGVITFYFWCLKCRSDLE